MQTFDLCEFAEQIGYLVADTEDFLITTTKVDPEISQIAGPQLVVPLDNARFALNAANARWGSLFDALYGTDAMGDLPSGKDYDATRGARVIAWGRRFLNENRMIAVPFDTRRGDLSCCRTTDRQPGPTVLPQSQTLKLHVTGQIMQIDSVEPEMLNRQIRDDNVVRRENSNPAGSSGDGHVQYRWFDQRFASVVDRN